MKNLTIPIVLSGAALLSVIFAFGINSSYIYAEDQKFKANLDPDNEVPAINSTGDGKVKIKVKDDVITSEINVTGIRDITGAHIYAANKSENGEAIVDLLKSGEESNTGGRVIIQGEITPDDFEGSMEGKTVTDLQTSMATEGTYINILTGDHPDGELRGQIKVSGSGNATKTDSTDAMTAVQPKDN